MDWKTLQMTAIKYIDNWIVILCNPTNFLIISWGISHMYIMPRSSACITNLWLLHYQSMIIESRWSVSNLYFSPLELGKLVRSTYVLCLGPLDQEVSTMDLLKRIELKMEQLTQQLERLPPEKVKISQRVSKIYQFHILINLSNRVLSRHYLDRLKIYFQPNFSFRNNIFAFDTIIMSGI